MENRVISETTSYVTAVEEVGGGDKVSVNGSQAESKRGADRGRRFNHPKRRRLSETPEIVFAGAQTKY